MWNQWLMTASVPEKYSAGKGEACKWGVKNKGRCIVKCLLFWYWALESRINIRSCDADCGWPLLTVICRLFAYSRDSAWQFSFFILFSRKCDKHVSSYFRKVLPDFYLHLSNFIVNLSSVGVPCHAPPSPTTMKEQIFFLHPVGNAKICQLLEVVFPATLIRKLIRNE